MSRIQTYVKEWEYVRKIAHRTIEIVDKSNAWDYRLAPNEFTVRDTFIHLTRAIFEDAGNWYLGDPKKFVSTDNPKLDINQAISRMLEAMRNFDEPDLNREFTFPWGISTTIESSIQQTMFHAIGHLAQLRERAGVCARTK